MSSPSFVAYIDEAGDEGFVFDKPNRGSSEWFVLAAAVMRPETERAVVATVDEVRVLTSRQGKPLHFRDMKHDQRLAFAARVGQIAALKIVVVMVHKPSLENPETYQAENRLYFYTARLLIERLSWYGAAHARRGPLSDGTMKLVFSNRSSTPWDKLRDDLEALKRRETSIDWIVIQSSRSRIAAMQHDSRDGLQMADLVASAFYRGMTLNYGTADGSYARRLLDRLYRKNGKAWGYGLKVFPAKADVVLQDAERRWLLEALDA